MLKMIQASQISECKKAKERLQSAPWKHDLYFYYFLFGHFGVWLVRATRVRGVEKLRGDRATPSDVAYSLVVKV